MDKELVEKTQRTAALYFEGVEDEKTLDLLTEMGCDFAQGYHIAKPMSFNDVIVFMKDTNQT